MLPFIDKKTTKYNQNEDWTKVTADNTSKMIDLLSLLVKTNQ